MKKKKSNMPILMGAAAFIIVLAIVIKVSTPNKTDYANMTEEEFQVAIDEKIESMRDGELGVMGERDRMEYYVKSFIDAIENKEYDEAYDMLYDEFKNNYFPTIDDFENYCLKKFPKFCDVEHTNIERNGDVYVLWVTLSDALAGKQSAVEINFVIQENDLNDFVMSFTVI